MKRKQDGNRHDKFDHSEARMRVCIVCFEAKGTHKTPLRDISKSLDYIIDILKKNVGGNFDANDLRQPCGLCDKCRKKYFARNSQVPFKLAESYLYTVIVSEDEENQPCECSICEKVRGNLGKARHPHMPHAGGRPKLSEDDVPSKKLKKASPPHSCSLCLQLKKDHDPKRCNELTKTNKVIEMAVTADGEVTKLGSKVGGVVVKAAKPSPTNNTIRLALPKTGTPVPLTLGPGKPKEAKMSYTVDQLWEMQKRDTMPNLHVDHIATVMNKGKRGIVEPNFQKKLKEKRTVCKPYFAEKFVFIYNKKKDEMEKKKMVYVKNLTEFIMFVIGERKVDPAETESLIEIDGGGSSVKFTLIIKQKKERKGKHLSSGVRRALVVCAMFDGDESNATLSIMIDIIDLHKCKCKFCNDLKVSVRLAGIMEGWPHWPCPYCLAHKDSLQVMGDLRTIWSLFDDFESYEEACIGLTSEKARKDECRNHNSVQFKPLLAKNKQSVAPTDLVLFEMPPDELHHLTGPFGKLYHCNRIVYPKIDEWSDELCEMKKYHSGTFVGNDCVKLLENIDELDRMMRADNCVEGLLFIPAF